MYKYSELDQTLVNERAAQFRDQITRWQNGQLSEEELRPLRLQNGLYIQRHAPMLRVAIPYGHLSATQIRRLGLIARKWDRDYGHFSTRQNIQFNWISLEDAPDVLDALAEVQMHAIQTSGNCIRNTTTDPFAGAAADEQVDPRPYCELLRQWSTFHPEFAFLPRKFKAAFTGSAQADRAAVAMHDLGFYLRLSATGEVVIDVLVGGGMGRTPIVGTIIKRDLPWQHMLTYSEAVLRVYNRYGRRDNKYKARIKILLRALGADAFAAEVENEFSHLVDGPGTFTPEQRDTVAAHFCDPAFKTLPSESVILREALNNLPGFARWYQRSVRPHRKPGYASVTLSLKRSGIAPGDVSSDVLDTLADFADQYSFSELRVTKEQNVVLAHVEQDLLPALWQAARAAGLATPNIGLLTDMICCPGGDFCSLANAKSIPIAQAIEDRFDNHDYLYDLGDITLNISGCINSCGHHHVGNIGVLGVDKHGSEFYQVTLGGEVGPTPAQTHIGDVIGRSFGAPEVPGVISAILDVYVAQRAPEETFLDTYKRIGIEPFRAAVYPSQAASNEVAHV